MKKTILTVFAMAGMACASTAFAGDQGWYLYGAVGQTFNNNDKANLDNLLTSAGASGFSSSLSKPTVYNLDIGYQLSNHLAFEGGYFGSNNETYTASGGNLGGAISASADVSGFDAKAVGILPLASQFSLLGKVGIADIKESATVTGPGGSASFSGSKTDITYGLGAKYDFTGAISARVDWDRYSVGDSSNYSHADVWTIGLVYKFK